MPRRQPVARAAVPADPAGLPTKQRIEQAALQLFAAKGFEATGIRDIADRAGLSTSALYHYMGSKDELLVAFMVESMTELTRVACAALDGAEGPAAQLTGLVRAHVGFHTLDAQRSLVADDELRALSDAAFTKVMQLRAGYERLWAEPLEGGTRRGCWKCATGWPAGTPTAGPSPPRRSLNRLLISPWRWSVPAGTRSLCGPGMCWATRPGKSSGWSMPSCAGPAAGPKNGPRRRRAPPAESLAPAGTVPFPSIPARPAH